MQTISGRIQSWPHVTESYRRGPKYLGVKGNDEDERFESDVHALEVLSIHILFLSLNVS